MASMEENTVTLPNENTEEEPIALVGRRSDNRKSMSSRQVLYFVEICQTVEILVFINILCCPEETA